MVKGPNKWNCTFLSYFDCKQSLQVHVQVAECRVRLHKVSQLCMPVLK